MSAMAVLGYASIALVGLAAVALLVCGLVGAIRWAAALLIDTSDRDPFDEQPTPAEPPIEHADICRCEDCAWFADEYAATAAELAPDFVHIDIRRLQALYLITPEGTK
jgi:hypothetical protein